MNTVEAVQCHLHMGPYDSKVVLHPIVDGEPPEVLTDEWFTTEKPRLFDQANEHGPVYDYEYVGQHYWYLLRREQSE